MSSPLGCAADEVILVAAAGVDAEMLSVIAVAGLRASAAGLIFDDGVCAKQIDAAATRVSVAIPKIGFFIRRILGHAAPVVKLVKRKILD
jgi:hypothetical protein